MVPEKGDGLLWTRGDYGRFNYDDRNTGALEQVSMEVTEELFSSVDHLSFIFQFFIPKKHTQEYSKPRIKTLYYTLQNTV